MEMTRKKIDERLSALRSFMCENGIDAFVFPSTDPHNGEYVPDHWKGREWISGFDGSAGTAVVTAHGAALWTDSRYFIAAAQQLEHTEYVLMRQGLDDTPTIVQWLSRQLQDCRHRRVGIDGMVCSASMVEDLRNELSAENGIEVVTSYDPLSVIWNDRPPLPADRIVVHPLEYAGEDTASKLSRIRDAVEASHADGIMVSALDDIAWVLNLRGNDVHCNPVFVSYLYIGRHDAVLFVDPAKVDDEVMDYLHGIGVETDSYDHVVEAMRRRRDLHVLADPSQVNHTLFAAMGNHVVAAPSPIAAMKAVKNEVEIEGYRRAMLRDGVAMVKFLAWLGPAVEEGHQTECSIDEKLTSLRAEQEGFRGLSFDTIAGYADHGAIVHYEATKATDATLRPEGFLLLDSGAQYVDGTTDITRTIALGPITDEMRKVYTLVLKGHIRLQMLKFPDGACGSQLDAVARAPLWAEGLNFLHGTGHGVGAYLNVHEGPHQIRMEWKPAPLRAGMTVTDEPGIYVEGKFGVRVENTLLISPYMTTPFGRFLQFEPLTLCPIDLNPVDWSLLDAEEKAWLNGYHLMVRERLSPFLSDHERQWLHEATRHVE